MPLIQLDGDDTGANRSDLDVGTGVMMVTDDFTVDGAGQTGGGGDNASDSHGHDDVDIDSRMEFKSDEGCRVGIVEEGNGDEYDGGGASSQVREEAMV